LAGERAVTQAQSQAQYIEFYAPCCHSIRSCSATADHIISLRTKKILRTIRAVRCGRGIVKKYKFYPSNDVVLVSHYISNRGVHHIKVLWKPQNVTTEEVLSVVRRALHLEEVVKIIVKDTVEEICEEEN
jgi:hypothetical protein